MTFVIPDSRRLIWNPRREGSAAAEGADRVGAGPASPAARVSVTRVEMLHLWHFTCTAPSPYPLPEGRGEEPRFVPPPNTGFPLSPAGRGQGEGAARRAFLRQQEQWRAGTCFQQKENSQTFFQTFSMPYTIFTFFFALRFSRPSNLIHTPRSDLQGNRVYNRTIREGAGAWRVCLSVGRLDKSVRQGPEKTGPRSDKGQDGARQGAGDAA